ncbi:MAG: response regulator, partial [Eubacteriales bacterium]|nr:response regulator [Eubacteriales bacterium]
SIPVVMLTANALSGMKEKFMQEGFSDYITKPITGEALEHAILSLLPEEKGQKETAKPAHRMEALAGELPELDLESALPYCAYNQEFLFEIMEKYFMGDRISNMEQAYQEKDWTTYQIEAHTLKSSAKTFGLNELSDQAKGLEYAARDKDTKWIEEHHSSVMQKLLQIKELVGKYTDTPDGVGSGEKQEERGEQNHMSERESKVKRLLIVDDEETNIRLISFALKNCEEYETAGAGSGEQAISLLRKERADLVLLDVKMPGMDGFETLRRIREFSEVPVMFLSGDGLEDKREELKKQGVVECLKKPVAPAALKDVLQRFFA